ncbi:DNA-binding protein [Petrimonas sp.]|uniref:DNA-binding protein n=1 Tax=Petrimonas sp. TaxID=2023866 RepID=UPI003F5153A2
MEVITIESSAYKDLLAKINSIAKFVIDRHTEETENPDEIWVDSYEVCTFLNISERTLQRLRSKGLVTYSIINGKSYYTIGEIKRILANKLIRRNEEALQKLIENHRNYVEQRRIAKKNK